jgi:hypothetical protein
MKRLFLISLGIALLAFSCNKKESPQDGGDVPDETDVVFNAVDTDSGEWNNGYVLRVGAAFYTLVTDTGEESDKTEWNAGMSLGEWVFVGEKRRLTYHGDGKVYNFYEVKRENGKEGFAWVEHIASGGRLAVVVDEKANLFRTPKTLDVTANTLPRKTVVALFPETERDGYVEIKAYDSVARTDRQNYVRISTLSQRDADIQSSILLQTAETYKNEGNEKIRRDVLLDSALTDYPNSVFVPDIIALVAPDTVASIQTEPVNAALMFVNDDNVNVRDIPDPVANRVTGQLNTGDMVTVDLQTVNSTTIDGYSAQWYHITQPIQGWVFGQFLGLGN